MVNLCKLDVIAFVGRRAGRLPEKSLLAISECKPETEAVNNELVTRTPWAKVPILTHIALICLLNTMVRPHYAPFEEIGR